MAAITPLVTLSMATFSQNKVEGLALYKGINLILILPAASFFMPEPWFWTLGAIPTFWTYWLLESFFRVETYWFYLLMGFFSSWRCIVVFD